MYKIPAQTLAANSNHLQVQLRLLNNQRLCSSYSCYIFGKTEEPFHNSYLCRFRIGLHKYRHKAQFCLKLFVQEFYLFQSVSDLTSFTPRDCGTGWHSVAQITLLEWSSSPGWGRSERGVFPGYYYWFMFSSSVGDMSCVTRADWYIKMTHSDRTLFKCECTSHKYAVDCVIFSSQSKIICFHNHLINHSMPQHTTQRQ